MNVELLGVRLAREFVDADWDVFSQKRPEYSNAERIWEETLKPALEIQDGKRRDLFSALLKRGLICGLPLLIFLSIFIPFGLGLFITIGITGAVLVVPLVQIFSFKSGVKDLVLSAASQSFGFKYDTLHPDVSNVNSWKSIKELAKLEAEKAKSRQKGFFQKDTGEDAPTEAFPVLESAGLLPNHSDRKFEDKIEGERAGARFSLVECKLTETRGSGNNRQTVTVFEGILLHIKYPANFLGRTVLTRAKTFKWRKRWKDLDEVKLVSVELDRAFTVYSSDQVEARALLTPDKLERLIALERFFEDGKLRGIFEGDHLTLALEAGNQFEVGSMTESLVNASLYRKALHELGLICDLIDGFLTREWAKGKL